MGGGNGVIRIVGLLSIIDDMVLLCVNFVIGFDRDYLVGLCVLDIIG